MSAMQSAAKDIGQVLAGFMTGNYSEVNPAPTPNYASQNQFFNNGKKQRDEGVAPNERS